MDIISDIVSILKDWIIWFCNQVIEAVGVLIGLAVAALPTWEPISFSVPADTMNVLGYLNWFFPVSYAVSMISLVVFSVLAYFTVGTLTRWAKVTN